MRALAPAAALIVLTLARTAAARESARLVYVRDASAASCPDEARFRDGVAAKLGYDAFDDRASRILTVRIARARGELEGVVITSATPDAPAGERRVTSAASDCRELADAMAFTVALLVDPRAASGVRDPEPPPPEPAAKEPDPFEPPPAPPSPPPRAREPDGLGVVATTGATAAAGIGLHAGLGIDAGAHVVSKRWTVGVEGRLDLPTERDGLEVSLLSASAVPCGRVAPLLLCGIVSFGALRGATTIPRADDASLFAAVGPRVALWLPLLDNLGVGAHADVLFNLTRTRFEIGGVERFSTGVAAGIAGVSAIVHFR